MKDIYFLLCCALPFVFPPVSVAETRLSDNIGGRIFSPSGNPHIVEQDVVVARNEQIVIKAGCVFLFNSFSGINVFGSMLVEGTEENPVVFTSINDAQYNARATQLPNPFDWNGIYIADGSGDIKFRNFKLMYSVFGIKSKKDNIILQSGQFKQNGQFHFTINDNIHYVQDNISYSYNVVEKKEPEKEPAADKKPAPKKQEKKEASGSKRKGGAVALMGVSVASAATCVIAGISAGNYFDKAENSTPAEFDDYTRRFKTARTLSIITGVTGGVTLPISLVLFSRKEKSTMTKKVSLNITAGKETMGLGVTGRF